MASVDVSLFLFFDWKRRIVCAEVVKIWGLWLGSGRPIMAVKLPTVGGRAFTVAGPTIWNNLPNNVISAPSLSTFHQRLKIFLFQASFRDIIIDPR